MSELISIIVPVYNCKDYLQATLASLRRQTYPNWEVILVDDGSTEETIEVIRQFAGRFHVLPESVYCYRICEGSTMQTLKVDSSYDMVSIHKMVVRFKEEAVNQADWSWFGKYYFRRLEFAYVRMRHNFKSPEFWLFALTKGGYVWKRWKEVHPEATWKTDLKKLMKFLIPAQWPL